MSMEELMERQKKIVQMADKLANGLSPIYNYLTLQNALIKMAEFVDTLPTKSAWFSASEKKPALDRDYPDDWVSVTVLVRMPSGYRATAHYDFENKTWRDAGTGRSINDPESWMYIPE
ncbi:MAG: hypothetical protein IJ640_00755 [Prevotella sp.]|nr:hypothetical protein [Prevotella sp.]